jgi:hypothetical protein
MAYNNSEFDFDQAVNDFDEFLAVLDRRGLLKDEKTIYDFFTISPNQNNLEACCEKIQSKNNDFKRLSNDGINKKYKLPAELLRDLIDKIITIIKSEEYREKYNTNLEKKLWDPIESLFVLLTNNNKILDLKEKADLIDQALRLDRNGFEVEKKIAYWLKRYKVSETDTQKITSEQLNALADENKRLAVKYSELLKENKDRQEDLLSDDIRLQTQILQKDTEAQRAESIRNKSIHQDLENKELRRQLEELRAESQRTESVNSAIQQERVSQVNLRRPVELPAENGPNRIDAICNTWMAEERKNQQQGAVKESDELTEEDKFYVYVFIIYISSAVVGWFIQGTLLWPILPYLTGLFFLSFILAARTKLIAFTALFVFSWMISYYFYDYPHISGIIWALYITITLTLLFFENGLIEYGKIRYLFLTNAFVLILAISLPSFSKSPTIENPAAHIHQNQTISYTVITRNPYLTNAYNHNSRVANGIVRNSKKLYFNIDYSGAIPNKTIFTFYWYRDGAVIRTNRFTVKSVKGHMVIPCKYNFNKFNSGVYQVGVSVNNSRVLQSDLSFKVIEADNSRKVVRSRMITTTTHKNSYRKVVPRRMITTTIQNITSETDSETQMNIENLAKHLEKLQRKSNIETAPTRMRSFNDAP